MDRHRDIVELTSSLTPTTAHPRDTVQVGAANRQPTPWLGLRFVCAGIVGSGGAYVRAQRDRAGTCYQARCPKCARVVRFPIGEGGTSDRMFRIDCGA